MDADSLDEFSFLADQATRLGLPSPAPRAERLAIDVDENRVISALRFGSKPPAVTFLHGAGLNAHTWDTTILALGLPALAIDLPGHGDSTWRDDAEYTASTMGPDIAAAIARATTTPQVLVGHSLGGMTAAWVAAHHPELVRALVLVDIAPGIDPSVGPEILRTFYQKLDFASRDEVVDYAQSFGMGGSRADTERGVFFNTRIRPDGRVEWKHHFAQLAASLTRSPRMLDGWADLASVTAPITLVRAHDGFIDPAALTAFRERLPHASIVEAPGGHNVQETQPLRLADTIRPL